MSTKAEIMAAIEVANKALASAALVASQLTEVPVIPPPVVQDKDVVIVAGAVAGTLLVTTRATITEFQWSLVQSNAAAGYPWYGPLNLVKGVPSNGIILTPEYARDGDFIKVIWGTGAAQSLDGPKDTKAVKPPVVVPPVSGLALPFKVRANLLAGVNVVRVDWLNTPYNGQSLTQPAYWQYLPTVGINWVRMFAPCSDDFGWPGLNVLGQLRLACKAAIDAGLVVHFGVFDVLGDSDASNWTSKVLPWADQAWSAIAGWGFSPDKFICETANELAGNDNVFWNPLRLVLHNTIRKHMPNHIISHGGAGWNHYNSFQADASWAPPPDKLSMANFHCYETSGDWSNVERLVHDFEARMGIPLVNGELGSNMDHHTQASDHAEWEANYRAAGQTAPSVRWNPWGMAGDQNDFRLNAGDNNAAFMPSIGAAILDMSNSIRTNPTWGK